MASNLLALASNLLAMASNLRADTLVQHTSLQLLMAPYLHYKTAS